MATKNPNEEPAALNQQERALIQKKKICRRILTILFNSCCHDNPMYTCGKIKRRAMYIFYSQFKSDKVCLISKKYLELLHRHAKICSKVHCSIYLCDNIKGLIWLKYILTNLQLMRERIARFRHPVPELPFRWENRNGINVRESTGFDTDNYNLREERLRVLAEFRSIRAPRGLGDDMNAEAGPNGLDANNNTPQEIFRPPMPTLTAAITTRRQMHRERMRVLLPLLHKISYALKRLKKFSSKSHGSSKLCRRCGTYCWNLNRHLTLAQRKFLYELIEND